MKIIKDGRTLRKFERLYNLTWDRTFKYLTASSEVLTAYQMLQIKGVAPKEYKIKFFDGCFCPYLIREGDDSHESNN